MKTSSNDATLAKVGEALAQLLGKPRKSIRLSAGGRILKLGGWVFLLEWSTGTLGSVAVAVQAVKERAAALGGKAIPLVAAPFMTSAGREHCEKAQVAWLDLSGNAHVAAPGIRILILGQPNSFKRAGRPSSAFASKGARIARWLLIEPRRAWSQRELAQAAQINEGYASRVITKLSGENLIERADEGGWRVRDPDLLLDAWRAQYRFERHQIIRGHIAARSGDSLLKELGEKLRKTDVEYAATGLGAAWLMTGFAGFRLTSVYLREKPSSSLLGSLSFQAEDRGANVWLIVPNDAGVFHGADDVNTICCVHPVQVILDLDAHPERAREAAADLRNRLKKGTFDA